MSVQIVKTESQLKKALQDGASEIIIENSDLIRKVHNIKTIRQVSVGAIAIAVPLIVAAIALAPVTGGLSTLGVVGIAAASGLSSGAVVAITGLIVLGTVAITALLMDYEEVDFSLNPPMLKLRKKS